MSTLSAEYPRPDHFLLHISDTHLLAGDARLYGQVAGGDYLRQLFDEFEASGARPEAIIFTGDLADRGEAGAYGKLREIVEPAAERLGCRIIWVMGNHDDRTTFRTELFDEPASNEPVDHVYDIDGLRVIALDTTVPGHHYGEVSAEQRDWLANELRTPSPDGTILALHHPPVPSMLELAATVELRQQADLAPVLRGSDVRSIIGGHLHYSSTGTFAGIPVSVASATCYTQDLDVPIGGKRGRDGAQGFNFVHVYPETVLHSVVPVGAFPILEYVDPSKSAEKLARAGYAVPKQTADAASAHLAAA